jgi:hypothetical protein
MGAPNQIYVQAGQGVVPPSCRRLVRQPVARYQKVLDIASFVPTAALLIDDRPEVIICK